MAPFPVQGLVGRQPSFRCLDEGMGLSLTSLGSAYWLQYGAPCNIASYQTQGTVADLPQRHVWLRALRPTDTRTGHNLRATGFNDLYFFGWRGVGCPIPDLGLVSSYACKASM